MGLAIYQKLQNLTMNQRGEVIDLECPLNGNIGIDAQISVNRPNGNYGDYYAFGARDVESGHAIMGASQLYRYGTYQTTFFYGTSSTYWSYATPVNLCTYRIVVPASGSVSLIGSSTRTVSRQSFSYPNHNLYIFGVHVKDRDKDYVEHNNTGYIRYVKVTNRGTLIRDMVPVKRLSDGICGLFDKISKKFFVTKSGNTSCLSGTVEANVYYDAQGNEMNSMESLVEKLNYTNETKGLIKSALQNKGIEVSDTDSFRSYVDKINSIQSGGGISEPEIFDSYEDLQWSVESEGALAFVKTKQYNNIQRGSIFRKVKFPKTVKLPQRMSNEPVMLAEFVPVNELYPAPGNLLVMMGDPSTFSISFLTDPGEAINIMYISSDGINYTRNDDNNEDIYKEALYDLAYKHVGQSPYTPPMPTWKEENSYFVQVETTTLDLYKHHGGKWVKIIDSTTVKEFNSVLDINNSTDNLEGDIGIVYEYNYIVPKVNSVFNKVLYPVEMELATTINDLTLTFNSIDNSVPVNGSLSINPTQAIVNWEITNKTANITYYSNGTDNVYNLTSPAAFDYDFGTMVKFSGQPEDWSDEAAKFMLIEQKTIVGIYQYKNGQWVEQSLGGGIDNSDTMGEYVIELAGEPTNVRIYDYIKTIPLLNTSNLTSMNGMFSGCSSIETIPLLDTSNVTNMNRMFASCSKLTDFPILDTSNVTNVISMFEGCKSLSTIDISKYNLQSTSSLDSMFKDCTSLTHVSLSNCNISHITNFKNLFNGCTHMTSIELTNVDLLNATQLTSMFTNCSSLTSIDFSKCGDMLKVSDLGSMLYGCSNLIDLNISNIDMGLITSINSFFGPESSGSLSCRSLENLQFGTNLGKGYTEQADNYKYYSLIIKHSTKLTHESLMNVINNLYDLNITYDVANGGTLYTQKLTLSSSSKSKLTAEEIAIATNKGWTVS